MVAVERCPEQAADLERVRSELFRLWRIGEEIGCPTPQYLKVYELVLLEMKARAPFGSAMLVAQLAAEWIRSSNPSFIDQAVAICKAAAIRLPDSLLDEVATVACQRISRAERVGTPDRVKIDLAKSAALLLIANLVHTGGTLSEACSKAANWFAITYPELKAIKASTFNVDYANQWRSESRDQHALLMAARIGSRVRCHARCPTGKCTLEGRMFTAWDANKSAAVVSAWVFVNAGLARASPTLEGTRR